MEEHKMIEYLLNYIEDYEIDYLKEQYTEEVINLLEVRKDEVIYKIEELLAENEDVDIYIELSQNIDKFI